MPGLRVKIDVSDGKNLGRKFVVSATKQRGRVLQALRDTMHTVSTQILAEGRQDISSAGKFGSRWTSGLQAAEDFGPDHSTITIFHTVPYWRIFQFGGVIQGRPLLWIPLSFSDAVGKRASEYGGGLFRVDRKSGGAPLLLSIADKQPKYFGKESVTIPKKFHLIEIARKVAGQIREIYKANFAASRS